MFVRLMARRLLPVCSSPLSVTSEAFVNRHGPPPRAAAAGEDKRRGRPLLTAGRSISEGGGDTQEVQPEQLPVFNLRNKAAG